MFTSRVRVPLLSAVTSGTSLAVDCRNFVNLAVFTKGTGTTSSGTIIIEEAEYNPETEMPYSGTWSTVTTLNASDVSGDATQAYHFATPEAWSFVRVRIGTSIGGGGSVSVVLIGNGN